jgi:uncharacterized protein involved in type VI secretion and phage assembly
MQYVLCRIEDDSSISLVSEHDSIVEGVAEGKRIVAEDDHDFAYRLLTDDGCKVATFGEDASGTENGHTDAGT